MVEVIAACAATAVTIGGLVWHLSARLATIDTKLAAQDKQLAEITDFVRSNRSNVRRYQSHPKQKKVSP